MRFASDDFFFSFVIFRLLSLGDTLLPVLLAVAFIVGIFWSMVSFAIGLCPFMFWGVRHLGHRKWCTIFETYLPILRTLVERPPASSLVDFATYLGH